MLIAMIYIPIWLDLLFSDLYDSGIDLTNLHSNMVRFIIKRDAVNTALALRFTFQYG